MFVQERTVLPKVQGQTGFPASPLDVSRVKFKQSHVKNERTLPATVGKY